MPEHTSYLSTLRIQSYKCYADCTITFQPGINIIIGPNNVGKTALLELLSFQFTNNPHITSAATTRGDSRLTFSVTADGFAALEQLGSIPKPTSDFCNHYRLNSGQDVLNWITTQRSHVFTGTYSNQWLTDRLPTLDTYPFDRTPAGEYTRIDFRQQDGRMIAVGETRVGPPNTDYGLDHFLKPLSSTSWYFQPDRIHPQRSPLAPNGNLSPHAENLAGVLQKLQADFRLDEYTRFVREVFPDLHDITARAIDGTNVNTFLFTRADSRPRPELGIPLADSGRGLPPVLAILYVLFTATESSRVIIDEPQSFLHPGALRRLLTVFQHHPQHQFLLATHSPLLVAAAGVQQCVVIKQTDGVSTAETLDATNVTNLRHLLTSVGASLTDVFGTDRIIWVEGPTEADCFTRILNTRPDLSLHGAVILPLRGTDDLRGRHARLAITIYDRLCRGNALLPPALAFQFDREGYSDSDRAELSKRTNARAFFTNRRMYENYLLHADAIAHVLNCLDKDKPATSQAVQDLLTADQERSGQAFQEWLQEVHGAKLLERIFKHFTNQCEYRKTTHGPLLTDWLLLNDPDALADLGGLLEAILSHAAGG